MEKQVRGIVLLGQVLEIKRRLRKIRRSLFSKKLMFVIFSVWEREKERDTASDGSTLLLVEESIISLLVLTRTEVNIDFDSVTATMGLECWFDSLRLRDALLGNASLRVTVPRISLTETPSRQTIQTTFQSRTTKVSATKHNIKWFFLSGAVPTFVTNLIVIVCSSLVSRLVAAFVFDLAEIPYWLELWLFVHCLTVSRILVKDCNYALLLFIYSINYWL